MDESAAWAILDESTRDLMTLLNKVYPKYHNLPDCKEKDAIKNMFNQIVDIDQTNLDLLYPARKQHIKAIKKSIKYL